MKLIFYAIMTGDHSVDFHSPGLTWFLHPLIRHEVMSFFSILLPRRTVFPLQEEKPEKW
jgi:hypothetical protein